MAQSWMEKVTQTQEAELAKLIEQRGLIEQKELMR